MVSLRSLLVAALCAGAMSWAQAALVTVSSSGVYDASVPNSAISAPNAAWSMQFTMEAEPQPFLGPGYTESGFFLSAPFASFTYTLNGVAVAQQPFHIALYNAGNGGGIDVFFSDVFDPSQTTTALSFYGPQIYSGDETDPTLQPGIYNTFKPQDQSFWLFVDDFFYKHDAVQIVVAAVPTPASWLLCLPGLLVLTAGARRRARRR